MSFVSRDLSPRIGTEIETDAATLLAGDHVAEIRELLELRGVLVFPEINLTDEQQLAFSTTIGEVIPMGENGIFKVSLDPKETETAPYLRGTILWHVDGFSDDVPTRASILSARRLSQVGGQTEFSNTYAAYEDSPEDQKEELQNLRIVHTMESTQRDVFPNPTPEMKALWDRHQAKTHPLVWTHQSGRKSLLLGSSVTRVVGMDEGSGRKLLDELMAWATQPQFVYRHEWTIGDMVIWDNTGVMHRVESYPADSGRMMHRTTLVGEESVA